MTSPPPDFVVGVVFPGVRGGAMAAAAGAARGVGAAAVVVAVGVVVGSGVEVELDGFGGLGVFEGCSGTGGGDV